MVELDSILSDNDTKYKIYTYVSKDKSKELTIEEIKNISKELFAQAPPEPKPLNNPPDNKELEKKSC